jgi:adhesin transport system outer membrane protein
LTALAFALAAVACAHADTLSFEQAARRALQSHPSVLGKQSALEAAKADLDAAKWQRYPTMSVQTGKANDGQSNTGALTIQQPLWTFGRISGGIDAARARQGEAAAAIDETRQDLLVKVINAYVEAMRQQARKVAAEQGLEQHQKLLDMITRRVEAEASAPIDKELAQSRLFQASNDLSSTKQALASALTQLSELTGQPVSAVADYSFDSSSLPNSVGRAFDLAEATSPTIRRLALEEQAADADITVKKSAYLPQLSLRYEKYWGTNPIATATSSQSSRVMLAVEAQPGAGLSAVSGVKGAEARKAAATQDRAGAERDLKQQVASDWDAFTEAQRRYASAQHFSTSSKAVYESYVRQYTTGRKTWLDVLNTVRESTQSDYAVIDARTEMTGAALRLAVRTGDKHIAAIEEDVRQ